MAKGVSVRIEGWEELERKLRQLGSTINERELLEGALMEGAVIVQDEIKLRAPYKTGQLRGSIAISKRGRQKYSVRIGPDKSGFYGRMLELGTSRMPARPFMRPAFDAVHNDAQRAISDAIWREVEKAAEANA